MLSHDTGHLPRFVWFLPVRSPFPLQGAPSAGRLWAQAALRQRESVPLLEGPHALFMRPWCTVLSSLLVIYSIFYTYFYLDSWMFYFRFWNVIWAQAIHLNVSVILTWRVKGSFFWLLCPFDKHLSFCFLSTPLAFFLIARCSRLILFILCSSP